MMMARQRALNAKADRFLANACARPPAKKSASEAAAPADEPAAPADEAKTPAAEAKADDKQQMSLRDSRMDVPEEHPVVR